MPLFFVTVVFHWNRSGINCHTQYSLAFLFHNFLHLATFFGCHMDDLPNLTQLMLSCLSRTADEYPLPNKGESFIYTPLPENQVLLYERFTLLANVQTSWGSHVSDNMFLNDMLDPNEHLRRVYSALPLEVSPSM
ncbi:hypothetical protein Pelo_15152 [Pelomyxa schiedti]|nr:hypothetical protein Pelo_15152 [Pelomyxa schiedti]